MAKHFSGTSARQRKRNWRASSFGVAVVIAIPALVASSAAMEPQRQSQTQRPPARAPQTPKPDYSNFSHQNEAHQTDCKACHTFPSKNWNDARTGDEAFPDVTDYPEHASCLNCHRQQFFARERPAPVICSNCHINVTPRNTDRYPFPSLDEAFARSKKAQDFVSQFRVFFPHETHIDVVSRNRTSRPHVWFVPASFNTRPSAQEATSCPVCHQTHQAQGQSDQEFVTAPPGDLPEDAFWLKKGTFKTGPRNHATCFTCHSEDSGIPPAPADCGTCHRLGPLEPQMRSDFDTKLATTMGITDQITLSRWRMRSAGRFRHEFELHAELSCITCHDPAVMNTLEEKTLVSVKSCGGGGSGCHIESNTDGILNFEIAEKKKDPKFECTKCHILLGKEQVPGSHLEAIEGVK